MFILGHICTIAAASEFRAFDLLAGEGALPVLLPDLASSHDWAYEHIWSSPRTPEAVLVQAHMIGDAAIHYGPKWSSERRRTGWAYANMGIVASEYEAFFARAERNGYLAGNAGDRDSRRGWAHTLVEYSVDQYLTDTRGLDVAFSGVRAALGEARIEDVARLISRLGAAPSKPFPDQPRRYLGVVRRSQQPDEFHLRGLAAKFELEESQDVLAWLRQILRDIVTTLGREELERAISMLTSVVRDAGTFGYPVPSTPTQWPGLAHRSSGLGRR